MASDPHQGLPVPRDDGLEYAAMDGANDGARGLVGGHAHPARRGVLAFDMVDAGILNNG